MSMVGQVLLDDLSSASEYNKESIKAAVVALLEKRVKPYKNADPRDMNTTLQHGVKTEHLGDPNAAFVAMVLQDLDKIIVERDRDECEILITNPAFREVTDESQIPGYQEITTIHQYLPIMQANMMPSMTTSMVAFNPLANVLREELVTKPYKRTEIRNSISQIILDFLTTGNCITGLLPCTNDSSFANKVEGDKDSRLVAFWASKMVKLDDDVINRIKKYLFPLKPSHRLDMVNFDNL